MNTKAERPESNKPVYSVRYVGTRTYVSTKTFHVESGNLCFVYVLINVFICCSHVYVMLIITAMCLRHVNELVSTGLIGWVKRETK